MALLVETQKGIITLKANNMEQARDAAGWTNQREHIAGLMRKERLLARFDVASLLVINAEQLLVVCFGAWLIPEGADEHRDALRLYQQALFFRCHGAGGAEAAGQNALAGPLDRVGDLLFAPL